MSAPTEMEIRSGDWKFIPKGSNSESSKDKLYNLREDISEKMNVAENNPNITVKLNNRIAEIKSVAGVRK